MTKQANQPPASMEMKANMPRVCLCNFQQRPSEREGVGAAGVGNFPSLHLTAATLPHSVRDPESRQAPVRKPTGFSKRARTDQSNHRLRTTGCSQGADTGEQFVQQGGHFDLSFLAATSTGERINIELVS